MPGELGRLGNSGNAFRVQNVGYHVGNVESVAKRETQRKWPVQFINA